MAEDPSAPAENRLKSWYEKGLPFKCTGCGKCCTGAPGYVWVTHEEVAHMAAHLEITPEAFIHKYVRHIGSKMSLIERAQTYDCVFLSGKQCLLYEARPMQCRTFPWWPQTLASPEAWDRAAEECEGINPDAPIVSKEEIDQQLARNNFFLENSGN